MGAIDGNAMARDALGAGHGHDHRNDQNLSAIEPGERLVSVLELQELLGVEVTRSVRDALGEMGAPIRRTRRGCVVPIAWVRANRDKVFDLAKSQ